jgi:hypothetical protein
VTNFHLRANARHQRTRRDKGESNGQCHRPFRASAIAIPSTTGARLMSWLAPSAFAADYTPPPPVTIGPATFTRWAGFYFGGQVGYSSSVINFGLAPSSEISYVLRGNPAILQDQQISQWPVLGSHSTASAKLRRLHRIQCRVGKRHSGRGIELQSCFAIGIIERFHFTKFHG